MSFRLIRELRNWAKALFGGKRMADEVSAELEQHIEFMMDDLMAKRRTMAIQ